MKVEPGATVLIAGGRALVVEVDAREGGARGIRVLRQHSGNWYLRGGVPYEAPSVYSEFIQDGFWRLDDQPNPSVG